MKTLQVILMTFGLFATVSCSHFRGGDCCCKKKCDSSKQCEMKKKDCSKKKCKKCGKKDCKKGQCDVKKKS